MDFGQRDVILRLGEVRSFIRKPYILYIVRLRRFLYKKVEYVD